MRQVIYKIHTETTGKNKGREYIIKTDIFNECPGNASGSVEKVFTNMKRELI